MVVLVSRRRCERARGHGLGRAERLVELELLVGRERPQLRDPEPGVADAERFTGICSMSRLDDGLWVKVVSG